MRILLATALIALLINPADGGQQEECAASPRWLVVTVVYGHRISEDGERFELPNGVDAIDRCKAAQMSELDADSQDPGRQWVWNAGARTQLSNRRGHPVWRYYVKETLQEICAALEDCRNATGR